MKALNVYGIALLLIIGTSTTLAGNKHDRKHDRRHDLKHYGQHYQGGKHHNYKAKHSRRHHYRRGHHKKRHHYYPRSHYRRHNYPSYLGVALMSSALTHTLYHTHKGAICYENHRDSNYRSHNGGYPEVVGCHRIERLADGSERRVEVPTSQCR